MEFAEWREAHFVVNKTENELHDLELSGIRIGQNPDRNSLNPGYISFF